MRKLTRLSEQWFYDLLDRGECDIVDFKERLEDRQMFGKMCRNADRTRTRTTATMRCRE